MQELLSGADVIITCPQAFRDNEKNTITCVVNSTSIAKLPCAVPPTQVNFVITKRTEESSSSMCYATYPCTTTSHPTTSRPCSCTDKTPAGIFSYTFLFAANKTIHENAKLACTACAGPVTERQENCDSLNFESYDGDSRTAGDDADSNSPGNTNYKIGNTASNASDMKGSSSSNLALIIGAIVGGVVAVAMVIGTAAWCYKKRSSGGHNAHNNTRSDTPPPIVKTAGPSADRGLAARSDVKPTEEDNRDTASETSDPSYVSETSEEASVTS
ncbi:uncharacterized protein [Littorina saxatilis]|uniref:uncharacterized protein n=1 Tax=Littorina saxatilis TaxID=31220 RepID=UPI0038B4E651